MAIIGQRQRRRFQQARRLGLKIPFSYKRIYNIKRFPKLIQEELVKYPETILDDSDFEEDNQVLSNMKYKKDITLYIIKNDERKREAIEQSADPKRIWAARKARGHKNFKDLDRYIFKLACDIGLSKQGLVKEMTKERRFGTHIKNENMSRKSTYQKGVEEELAKQISIYVEEDPDCFVNDRDSRDKLLARFELDRTVLKQYPNAITAMFVRTGDQVPADLYIEEKPINGKKQSSVSDKKQFQIPIFSQQVNEEEIVHRSSSKQNPVYD